MSTPAEPWPADTLAAAALLAVDPAGLGGLWLRARASARRERWLTLWRALLPAGTPQRRVPLNVTDERLLGGLDLTATLARGRPVGQPGLLAEADGGVLCLAMAERLSSATAARLAAVLDTGRVAMQRDGLADEREARLGVLALHEGVEADERPPAALLDRLALVLDLDASLAPGSARADFRSDDDLATLAADLAPDVERARATWPRVTCPDAAAAALCQAALALGVSSLRAPLLALRVARMAAALQGRDAVDDDDLALAARLVLAPRATQWPADAAPPPAEDPAEQPADPPADTPADAPAQDARPATPPPGEPARGDPDDPDTPAPDTDRALDDVVLEAAVAALPPDLLARLAAAGAARGQGSGRQGVAQASPRHGRPVGVRAGEPGVGGARLALLDTLRAAAPWQRLRQRSAPAGAAAPRVRVQREDFRIQRLRQPTTTTTVFAVDASGSAALHRLAEAKGAVELLLADCYVRRDEVALIAFRGTGAELLLPPTRSLVRAKRALAGLPGGGGTPLASGLDAAQALLAALRRRGQRALLVLLTDGRANIGRDGQPGRERAQAEALAAAAALRALGTPALLLDVSVQPQAAAQGLAQALGARYLLLPHADAQHLTRTVQAALA